MKKKRTHFRSVVGINHENESESGAHFSRLIIHRFFRIRFTHPFTTHHQPIAGPLPLTHSLPDLIYECRDKTETITTHHSRHGMDDDNVDDDVDRVVSE